MPGDRVPVEIQKTDYPATRNKFVKIAICTLFAAMAAAAISAEQPSVPSPPAQPATTTSGSADVPASPDLTLVENRPDGFQQTPVQAPQTSDPWDKISHFFSPPSARLFFFSCFFSR